MFLYIKKISVIEILNKINTLEVLYESKRFFNELSDAGNYDSYVSM